MLDKEWNKVCWKEYKNCYFLLISVQFRPVENCFIFFLLIQHNIQLILNFEKILNNDVHSDAPEMCDIVRGWKKLKAGLTITILRGTLLMTPPYCTPLNS